MAICRGDVHHRTRKSDEQEGQMEATRLGYSVTQDWILLTSHTKEPRGSLGSGFYFYFLWNVWAIIELTLVCILFQNLS